MLPVAFAAALVVAVVATAVSLEEPAATLDLAGPEEPITPIPPEPWQEEARIELGRRLFDDPRLSGSGKVSCASCHDLSSNGASGIAHDRGTDGSDLLFNTATVFNASLSFRYGWEGRHRDLASHAAALIESPAIMDSSLPAVVLRLSADAELAAAFRKTYGRALQAADVVDAIVAFEQSLVTPGSRFDRWLAGDATALTAEELEGYRLFKSTGCISCHQGVAVGGNLFQRQGVFHPLVASPPEVVRVPSLRNVATTAPYFHDGSAETLDEAIRRIARAQLDADLADADVGKLMAFLNTLTGSYRGAAVRPAP